MKGKAIIPLVLGLLIGIAAVKWGIDTIKDAQASNPKGTNITVVTAREDITAYEEITKAKVETVETADNALVPAGSRLTSLEDAVGRVAGKAIPKGVPILASMLAPEGTKARMAGRIPPGFRAISVRIDEVSGVAYQLNPGDWVDVIVVKDTRGGGSNDTIARVILEHVQVAAVGRAAVSASVTAGAKQKAAKSVTLLVPTKDVTKLHLAASGGKLTLSMRGDDDERTGAGMVARGSEVFASGQETGLAGYIPPAPLPAGAGARSVSNQSTPYGVAVYHGGLGSRVEQFMFESSRSRNLVGVLSGPLHRGPTDGKASTDRQGSGSAIQASHDEEDVDEDLETDVKEAG
jgi:Flp pilus assembly protein CpaB